MTTQSLEKILSQYFPGEYINDKAVRSIAYSINKSIKKSQLDVPDGWVELPDTEKKSQWIDGAKFNPSKTSTSKWSYNSAIGEGAYAFHYCRIIIPQPKTFESHGLVWTRHKPGDPIPCNPEDMINYIMQDELNSSYNKQSIPAGVVRWDVGVCVQARVVGWRYADKKTVKLGPSDIPLNSVFRWKHRKGYEFYQPDHVCEDGVYLSEEGCIHMSYEELMDQCEINRPKHRDADGNPTLWEPCSKEEV